MALSVWLITRPGWLPVVGAFVLLLEGMTTSLFLLHRWAVRRFR